MAKRCITPVDGCQDKQRTYQEQLGQYKMAVKYGFYLEALMIDYALLEDRFRSFLYHIGALKKRISYKVDNEKVKPYLKGMVTAYVRREKKEKDHLGITSISGKMKIVRCSIQWEESQTEPLEDRYLKALKKQYEGLDMGGMLLMLENLESWCDYRNEVVHALMNKNMDSLQEKLEEKVLEGHGYVRFLDSQVKLLKKGNKVRRAINLSDE